MSLITSLKQQFTAKGERSKAVLSGSFLMMVSTLINNLTRVGLISILARIYTKDEFGLWVTITSATAIMATNDFGIGIALRNKLAEIRVKNKDNPNSEASHYFFSVLYFFLLFSIVVSVALLLFRESIPYDSLLKTDNLQIKNDLTIILIVVQTVLFLSIPFNVGSIMYFAYMETSYMALFNILNGIIGLVVVSWLAYTGKSVTIAAIAFFMVSFFIAIISTIQFVRLRKWKLVWIAPVRILKTVKNLLASSLMYAILQIGGTFLYNSTTILVTANIGLTDAAEFNLIQKIYTFIIAIYLSLYNPLWAAYSDAIHRNDWKWAKDTLLKAIGATILVFLLALISCSIFGNYFLRLLAGSHYISNSLLFSIMGGWALFYSLYLLGIAFLTATGKVFSATIATGLIAFFYIQIGEWYGLNWGITGIATWSLLAFLVLTIATYTQIWVIVRRKLHIHILNQPA